MTDVAVRASRVTFRYGERVACNGIDFAVETGRVHGFLGPNGSGKSTLFKILATAYPLQEGEVSIAGLDLRRDAAAIRPRIGVVFQSPALDGKLTVRENLTYGGHMYGLSGVELRGRVEEMLRHTGLEDRARDKVKDLSGGLRRRVALAKGLLSRPSVVLLDEPSTGLDPGARRDLWRFLRSQQGLTVLFTTHLMDEAEQADQVTIMSEGKIVASGTPAELVREIGGQVLEIATADPAALAPRVEQRLHLRPTVLDRTLRIERSDAHRMVQPLWEAFGPDIGSIRISPPSLEDVYIRATGHRFWGDGTEGA